MGIVGKVKEPLGEAFDTEISIKAIAAITAIMRG
jgi:hypothetical protein